MYSAAKKELVEVAMGLFGSFTLRKKSLDKACRKPKFLRKVIARHRRQIKVDDKVLDNLEILISSDVGSILH